MLGIARTNRKPQRQAKALPVCNLGHISKTLAHKDILRAVRDNALLQVGFFGGFRSSGLVTICLEHVSWEEEGTTITLPRSKTDQTGEGITKALPCGSGTRCPVTALRQWLERAALMEGPVFRSISRCGKIQPAGLHASSVNDILAARPERQGSSMPFRCRAAVYAEGWRPARVGLAQNFKTSKSRTAGVTMARFTGTSRKRALL